MPRHTPVITGHRLLLGLGALALVWSATVVWTGGIALDLAGAPLTSRDPVRPFLVGVALLAGYVAGSPRLRNAASRLDTHVRLPEVIAMSCAAGALAVGVAYGTFIGSGPDAGGYVSQASWWASGRLSTAVPEWVRGAPWADAALSAAPVGYRPSTDETALVPIYPPGLPMAMALFEAIAGPSGAFYVVPIGGALAIAASFLLGRQIGGRWAGAVAAVLMASSPVFLWMLIQPMTDVPAAAAWALAVYLAGQPGRRPAALAGCAVAAGLLVRPNLLPLVAVPAALLCSRPARIPRLAVFAAAPLAAMTVIAGLNWFWYGGPLRSGHGELGYLYALARIWPNVTRYAGWLEDMQTPLIFAGVAAALLDGRGRAERLRTVMVTAIYPAAVLSMYLPYLVFDGWSYLRFLLPAFPALFAGVGALAVEVTRRARRPDLALALVVAVLALVANDTLRSARGEGIFGHAVAEQRYARAVRYISALPQNTVVVSLAHSGPLWHYARRDVLRWEWVRPTQLDLAIEHLRQRGHPVYLVVDGSELADFRRRFMGSAAVERLDAQRAADLEGVLVYKLSS